MWIFALFLAIIFIWTLLLGNCLQNCCAAKWKPKIFQCHLTIFTWKLRIINKLRMYIPNNIDILLRKPKLHVWGFVNIFYWPRPLRYKIKMNPRNIAGGCTVSMKDDQWGEENRVDGGWKEKGEEGSRRERGRGTETEGWLGVQFGAVTQEPSKTMLPSRLPNTTHVQEAALNLCAPPRLHNQSGCGVQEWWCERPRWRQPFSFFSSAPLPRPKLGSTLLK